VDKTSARTLARNAELYCPQCMYNSHSPLRVESARQALFSVHPTATTYTLSILYFSLRYISVYIVQKTPSKSYIAFPFPHVDRCSLYAKRVVRETRTTATAAEAAAATDKLHASTTTTSLPSHANRSDKSQKVKRNKKQKKRDIYNHDNIVFTTIVVGFVRLYYNIGATGKK